METETLASTKTSTQVQTQADREREGEASPPRRRGWLDERLDLEGFRKKYLRKAFPVHPTFFLGEIALFSFVVLVLTGIYLAFAYEPSARIITVDGLSAPAAYHSVLQIDKQAFGLIVRQVHHWSAHLMIASALLHLLRIFFMGAYRRPREINWLIGCLLLIFSVFAAFSGYLLPYDEFAVTATGIGYGIVASVPWVGQALADFFFGGKFPALGTVPRFYGYHVMLLPLILLALIAAHMLIMLKQKHTEPFWNRGKVEPGKLLGIPLWPQQAALMAVLFLLMVSGVLLLASTFPVHPVEVYGPPGPQTPPVKPDWYFLWVYGLLKLIPGWMEFRLWGGSINPEVIGGVLLPGLMVLLLIFFPFFERSRGPQHYLERPSERPGRTALGVAALALLAVLSAAGYEDVLQVPLQVFRWAALIVPLASGAVTYAIFAQVGRLRRQRSYRF